MNGSNRVRRACAALPERLAPLVQTARRRGVLIVATLRTLAPRRSGEPIISLPLKALLPLLTKKISLPLRGQLVEPLAPPDIGIEKIAYSAFYKSRLEYTLRKCGIAVLCFTGIVINGAAASTARDAHVREFDCTIIEDGWAAFSDKLHPAAIEGLRPVATISNIAEVMDALSHE